MKFNKIYAAKYLEGGALHLSRNPHGAISMSSNALRHYTEAVTGRSIPLHYLDDDGDDDDDLPPPPPPAEPCPYKKDKDGVHRPVAEDLPALKINRIDFSKNYFHPIGYGKYGDLGLGKLAFIYKTDIAAIRAKSGPSLFLLQKLGNVGRSF